MKTTAKYILSLLLGVGIGTGAVLYNEGKLPFVDEAINNVKNQLNEKTVSTKEATNTIKEENRNHSEDLKSEVKEFKPEVKKEESQEELNSKLPTADFDQNQQQSNEIKNIKHISFLKEPNFYSYEEYNELRDREAPNKSDNVLFKGRIINVASAEPTSDYKGLVEKYLSLKDEDLLNQPQELIGQLRLISYLNSMTGFSLSSNLKDLNHTVFVFIDFGQNMDKQIQELVNIYNATKEKGYNVIVYPLALQEGSERDSYTWLKTMSITTPEEILKLNETDFKSLFPALTTKEYAKIFQDGVNSNNLIYVNKIGFANPFTVLKTTRDEKMPYLFYHDIDLSKEQIIEFLDK